MAGEKGRNKDNKRKSDRYGVPMIQYCREHEKYVEEQLKTGADRKELLEWHEKKLAWIQHERLVHLLVTILTAIVFLFSVALMAIIEWSPAVLLLQLILVILLAAYLRHYFQLENTVQHWYRIADKLHEDKQAAELKKKI